MVVTSEFTDISSLLPLASASAVPCPYSALSSGK